MEALSPGWAVLNARTAQTAAETAPQLAPYCHDGACHPVNGDGYVTDGSIQADDAHCSTPPGSAGPEPGQDQCLAARNGGFVTDGDAQIDDEHCTGSPHQIGACLAARRGLPFSCLAVIVNHEDPAWDPTVWNGSGSGAYGLPQALPGYKMASAGADWRTSARTQLVWLLDRYAPGVYGGICPAAAHEQRFGTY